MEFEVGEVIKILDFDIQKHGVQKPRWFVYLGRTDIFENPICLHIATTTTQVEKYHSGNRKSNAAVFFKSTDSPFDLDCVLDLNETPYSLDNKKVQTYTVEKKGSLTEPVLRQIFNKLKSSPKYSRKIIKDIQRGYKNINIDVKL